MSLCRVANVTRSRSSLMANRAVANALATSSVLKRYYWWNRKGNKDDGKKDETKKKPSVEKENEEKTALKEENKENVAPSLFDNANIKKSVVIEPLNRGFNPSRWSQLSGVGSGLGKVGPSLDDGAVIDDSTIGSLPSYFGPRPVRLHDEMVIPAIPLPVRPLLPGFIQNLTISDRATIQKLKEVQSSPDRYVGLFLRKERSSNDLADNPDVIHSLADIFEVGTCVFNA